MNSFATHRPRPSPPPGAFRPCSASPASSTLSAYGTRARPSQRVEAQEDFEAAAEEAKTLSPEPTDEDKLVLYGLFKQATVGDVNTGACGLPASQRCERRSLPCTATVCMPLWLRQAHILRLA